MRYDHPNVIVRREQSFTTAAGNGTVGARMVNFQKTKLIAAHVRVVTAGTTAGNTLTFKNGTTSIGAVTLTTNTAGVTTSIDLGNSLVSSLELVSATNGTDATGVAVVTYEYEVTPDTTLSS